jgi:hypothetical protein
MDPELQAQLTHIIALLNSLDRKLDDMADQLAIEIIDSTDD